LPDESLEQAAIRKHSKLVQKYIKHNKLNNNSKKFRGGKIVAWVGFAPPPPPPPPFSPAPPPVKANLS